MAARLEHQAGADPVVVAHKMLTALTHGGALQRRGTAGDDADGVSGGMCVNAKEGVAAHWKRSMPKGSRPRSRRPATRADTWRAVAADSVRPRWPWPNAKRIRGSFGWGPMTA